MRNPLRNEDLDSSDDRQDTVVGPSKSQKQTGPEGVLCVLSFLLAIRFGTSNTSNDMSISMDLCRREVNGIGPLKYAAQVRDIILQRMNIAVFPQQSSLKDLKRLSDTWFKFIATRKGRPFIFITPKDSSNHEFTDEDILRFADNVGDFEIDFGRVDDNNIRVIMVFCLSIILGSQGQAPKLLEDDEIPQALYEATKQYRDAPKLLAPPTPFMQPRFLSHTTTCSPPVPPQIRPPQIRPPPRSLDSMFRIEIHVPGWGEPLSVQLGSRPVVVLLWLSGALSSIILWSVYFRY
ncbi:hypothetical protein FSARC_7466 [Fusarium sarcochroum]|uniref:Uncharacterized protein n=1 Tax=Fusarium sarcochroum TaxID=1208366 RepID=A0A8H4X880_9HYPO|nr:hypothetical protein FSARC_7466 [Fusarium sarcochroum]